MALHRPGSPGEIQPLLSTEEVANILGVNARTVRRLADRGCLRRIVLGHRTTRYAAADVAALIERSTPEQNRAAGGDGDPIKRDDGAHHADYAR